MKIVAKTGDPRFAEVYVAEVRDDPNALIEFVDAVDPRYPREQKWVIIVSTQIGCPIKCPMCDSGAYFLGNLTKDEIFAQIDYIFTHNAQRTPHYEFLNHPKLKIQFARMGEPALNGSVLDVMEELPSRYPIPGLMPCIATTAPAGTNNWFERLLKIKNCHYTGGKFQLQFSINSSNEGERDRMIPARKWSLADIAYYGSNFYKKGDRKVALNFALIEGACLRVGDLKLFDTDKFLVKITPVNPTDNARRNLFDTVISAENPNSADSLVKRLEEAGFETIVSIGAPEEIAIGSNCGQSAVAVQRGKI